MSEANPVRPGDATFTYAGATVELTDAATILAAARVGPVVLLRGAAWPAAVRWVEVRVSSADGEDGPAHLFTGEIGIADQERVRSLILGRDPVGLLLSKRIEAGDPVVTRIVDGVGAVAVAAYRKLGLDWAAAQPVAADRASGRLVDADLGLAAEISYDPSGTVVRLRAAVPREEVNPDHLRSFVGLTLQAVLEIAGPDSLRGRRYTVSREPLPAVPVTTRSVTLDQVGGLSDVVSQLRQIALSFQHPEAMARWGARRPQGILMYGPPGTGKTMLCRALANEIGADFREIRTPEILDKWLGGSERNIKQIFRDARRYRVPTLILFDEFDSIISYAGAGGDAASQAINAVAGIFKQEMNDLIEANPNVLVVATTNFPHRVDASLIRSGRFDVKISVPKPDEDGRAEIFRKMIRGLIAAHEQSGFRIFADDLDLTALAQASRGMTGADIKEVLRRVQLAKAMQDARTGGQVAPINQHELIASITDLAGPQTG
ncbi:MAG TPA: ATP-binding protein [Actinophytocola sp.]|uniref:ATP-binding protein n=1 Tax=Actinophytocola sp. TaxID=1872138 RepID=UPI002DB836EB|nr:ATP-binding protein [Actinophytocola sp.]HEU5469271.1 ATP-binding protein [Actinophytocola sp.]